MCLHCHSSFSDEQIIAQLRDEQNYEKWNTTSVYHLALTASGRNGEIARQLALELFLGLIEWRRTKPDGYMPESGMESMYTVYDLERIYKISNEKKLDELENFKPIHKLKRRNFGKRNQDNSYYWGIGIVCVGILAFYVLKVV
jgi:hypothetical protein